MKKKIISILICMLLMAIAVPVVESLQYSIINTPVPSITLKSMMGRWTKTQKLHARDGSYYDNFGGSVSLDGDTALMATLDNSAYVFTRTRTIWRQQAKLLASDGAPYDNFGFSVSLSGDTALIGACADDDNGNESGSAYVFTRTGTTWTQQAKLLALDGAAGDSFGYAVSLDGNTALIGAISDDDNGVDSGSAYVFTRTGTTWTQQAKLLASHGADLDFFSGSVSLDGDIALIGAPAYMQIVIGIGSVYVFTRTGTTWTQHQKLRALDDAPYDSYGYTVSLDNEIRAPPL